MKKSAKNIANPRNYFEFYLLKYICNHENLLYKLMKRFFQKFGSSGFNKSKELQVFMKLRKTRISIEPVWIHNFLIKKSLSA